MKDWPVADVNVPRLIYSSLHINLLRPEHEVEGKVALILDSVYIVMTIPSVQYY